MHINELHLRLFMQTTKTQRLNVFWRSMQYNQTITVNSCGLSVVRKTHLL